MKYASALLLIGVIGLAAFGLFGMHVSGLAGHDGNCALALAQAAVCPESLNPIEFLAFHLDAFKKFSTATFGLGTYAFLLLFALTIMAGFGIPSLALFKLPLAYAYGPKSFYSPPRRKFLRWLARHENSPNFFS